MKILGIIPARYASTRFPGKPLADIGGKSMIRRVYEQCKKADCLTDVVVATDDHRIFEHVLGFGGQAVMTASSHSSGTERCRETLQIIGRKSAEAIDAVINIQGDEPFISPLQIEMVGQLLAEPNTDIATLVKRISDPEDIWDPNVVKVVLNRYREALYFSRSPIPFLRGKERHDWPGAHIFYKHIGIYGYQSDILDRLPDLDVSPLETAESLEQLRWLGWGLKIRTAETDIESISIDTPSDLLKITNIS